MNSAQIFRGRWRLVTVSAALVAAFAMTPEALAQTAEIARPTIRDIVIGAPISAQPMAFQEFACGTNGGPPSLQINGFAQFSRCRPESTGLYEVQFRYDDELHYLALARLDPLQASLFEGTKIGNFPILASALIDDAGIVRGIRAVTDDRVSDRTRRIAYTMPVFIHSIYGSGNWECVDTPAAQGETPVGNTLIKQDCRKLTDDRLVMTTQARLLRRPGQTLIDPVNGLVRAGYYESTARMEIYEADALGNPIFGGGTSIAQQTELAETPVPFDTTEAFLAGFTIDCPGCDLSGANLKGRNLAGADLTGANLSGATLHRALLGGATLDGADLTGANLNVADLKRASLVDADMTRALLYQTDAAAADFSGAVLDGAVAENARFTSAAMVGVHWQSSYALGANLASADLSGAVLVGTVFVEADLQRAVLAGADLTDATFYRSRLRGANLSGVTALRTDFLEADLADALFVDADLTGARLLRARSSGTNLNGAVLVDTILPNGTIGP